jgi:hypothetical protein
MHSNIYNKNRPEALLNARRSERRYAELGWGWVDGEYVMLRGESSFDNLMDEIRSSGNFLTAWDNLGENDWVRTDYVGEIEHWRGGNLMGYSKAYVSDLGAYYIVSDAFRNIKGAYAVGVGSVRAANGGGMPDWASDANTGVNAFMVGNGAKTGLLDYAVRTNYNSARTASQFNKLRPTQQAWRTTNTLGKTGAQYLKYAKGLGYVGAGLTTTYSAVNAGSYYYNGGTDWQVGTKATLDVIMTGVGFLGPIGFGISAIYFIVDAAGGFGDFGEY